MAEEAWTLHEANRSTCLSVSVGFFFSFFVPVTGKDELHKLVCPNICVFIAQLVQ